MYPEQKKIKVNPANSPKVIVVWLIIMGIFFVIAFRTCEGTDDRGGTQTLKELHDDANVIAQNFVESKLTSPSTAKFPLLDFTTTDLADSTYDVKSYVDSQNGFGAIIRTNYEVVLKYNGGEWSNANNWTLISIQTN